MVEFLTSPLFKEVTVPLFAVFLNILVKYSSRRHDHPAAWKEDLAVGLEIGLTAIVAAALYIATLMERASAAADPAAPEVAALRAKGVLLFWFIVVAIFLLWFLTQVVQRHGWKSPTERNWPVGVVLPMLYGIGALIGLVQFVRT